MAAGPTARLASFAATLDLRAVPAPVLDVAKRLLLDTLGCALGGARVHAGRLVLDWVARAGTGDEATVAGTAHRTSAALAAYGTARLAALLDADETYPSARQVSHLAAGSVGAALATTEARGGSGADLLAAIIAGYEVGARLSSAMIPATGPGARDLRAGWGPGSPLGATCAAGRAIGLDGPTLAHALGLAGTHVDPPPLQWTEVRPAPMAKSADAGWHAQAGVAAATMAEAGLTGYDRILDGPSGLWRALGYVGCDWDALDGGLGERWAILDASFKAWPCQYWMHPALTALASVLEAHDTDADAVTAIRLRTNEKSLAPKFHDAEPPGEVDRSFSFPHAAAMLVAGVPSGPAWFAPELDDDPAIRRLRTAVTVELHPDATGFEAWVVDHVIRDLPADARVTLRDGRTFEATARLGRGSPWSPLTALDASALRRKAAAMAGPSVDVEALGAWIETAEVAPSLAGLLAALEPARAG